MELNISYKKSLGEFYNEIINESCQIWLNIMIPIIFLFSIFSPSLIIYNNYSDAILLLSFMISYITFMFYFLEVKFLGFNFDKNKFRLDFNFDFTNNNKDLPRDNIKGKLCHDINGNIYVNIENLYYLITINKDDDIELYNIDTAKLVELKNSKYLEYDKIVDSDFTSLKKKVMDKIEQDEDSDQEENYQNYRQKIKYLDEDKYYYSEYKEKDISDGEIYDDEKDVFKFYKKDDKTILLLNMGIDSPANYDTYIRENTKNVLVSLINNNTNAYRISFYKINNNGRNLIELNIIGSTIKAYHLCYGYNDNGIELKCYKFCEKNNY